MDTFADRPVTVHVAAPRAIAAVRALVPVDRVPVVFVKYLNQVYAAARDGAIQLDGQNVFVYRDGPAGEIDVEFGVGVTAPFSAAGPVTYSELPVGEVAATTHWGDYVGLGDAHNAVIAWARANGRAFAGPRWEVYGHWTDDRSRLRTDVYYLLAPSA